MQTREIVSFVPICRSRLADGLHKPGPRPRPTAHPSPAHTAPAAAAEPWLGLLDRPVKPRALARFESTPEVRPLPSAGITRLPRCYEPVRHPSSGPACPARASGWQEFPRHRWAFPCCVLHIRSFEACSVFTHVMACWLAGPPGAPWQRRLRRSRYRQRRSDCYRLERKLPGGNYTR